MTVALIDLLCFAAHVFSPMIYLISKGEELQRSLSHGEEEGSSNDNNLGMQLAAIILCK